MESRPWGTVVWEDRAGTCGTAVGVSNFVEQGLAGGAAHDPLFVRAEIDRARVGRARASLFLRRGSAIAVRDLDAASCEELARSSAVVIAMAYEMGLDPQPAPAPAAPPSEQEERASPPMPPPVEPAPSADKGEAPPRAKAMVFAPRALSFAPMMDYGTVGSLAAGVRGRFARDFGIIGVAFYGTYLPSTSTESTLGDVKLDMAYAAGGLRLFRSWSHRNWTFELGVGASLGQYWLDAGGTPLTRDGKPPYAAIETSLETTYRVTESFRIRTGLEHVLHANRPAYSAVDHSVWDRGGTAYRVSIGPELVF